VYCTLNVVLIETYQQFVHSCSIICIAFTSLKLVLYADCKDTGTVHK